jgi:hypothetical protein
LNGGHAVDRLAHQAIATSRAADPRPDSRNPHSIATVAEVNPGMPQASIAGEPVAWRARQQNGMNGVAIAQHVAGRWRRHAKPMRCRWQAIC